MKARFGPSHGPQDIDSRPGRVRAASVLAAVVLEPRKKPRSRSRPCRIGSHGICGVLPIIDEHLVEEADFAADERNEKVPLIM